MALRELIIEKIRENGPLSFHDYMEMALYYPALGYYTSEKEKVGKYGDYYTSPHCTSLFGEIIGKQLEEMWEILGRGNFTIVEFGAGSGNLAHDIINYAKHHNDFYENLYYYIIEKSPTMRQKEKLILDEKIFWCNSIEEIPEITGCILSNEVLDNFSVHRVTMLDDLMEIFVDYNDCQFKELLIPANDTLQDYLKELDISLPGGFCTEINLQATDWIQDISTKLCKGFVLTIDYGYPSRDFFNEKRNSGTLLCYSGHTVNYSPYDNIGEQDITAHVNFSALNHWGIKSGLDYCGFTNQLNFLRGLGLTNYLRKMEQENVASEYDKKFLLNTFIMDMGKKFKILIQSKNINKPFLSGLSYCEINF